MSRLLNTINEMDNDAIASLGNTSDKCREAGAHLVTIARMYETAGNGWDRFNIDFTTAAGEALDITSFFGNPKDNSPEEIAKAAKADKRVAAIIARLVKSIGIKDVKQATANSQSGTDDKGNAITIFPKVEGKKLYIVSSTEIQPDKDGTKAYANQVVDTFKFLDKDGKDPMGRDRLEAFDAEAKENITIQYGKEQNPACIQLKNQLLEQKLGTAPAAQQSSTPQQTTQPAQQQAAVNDDSDDI